MHSEFESKYITSIYKLCSVSLADVQLKEDNLYREREEQTVQTWTL